MRREFSIMSILGDSSGGASTASHSGGAPVIPPSSSPTRSLSAPPHPPLFHPPYTVCPRGHHSVHHHHHKHHHHAPPLRKPRLVVLNDHVLSAVAHLPSTQLGTIVYSHHSPLPRYDAHINATVTVIVPARLIPRNPRVSSRFLWGTDVYTDDSDLVAGIYYTYCMAYNTVMHHTGHLPHPWADAQCTLRILPPLKRYSGCTRNSIKSRSWVTPHDGLSYMLENVQWLTKPVSRRRKQTQLQLEQRQQSLAAQGTVLRVAPDTL